jgi:hypothetical protein
VNAQLRDVDSSLGLDGMKVANDVMRNRWLPQDCHEPSLVSANLMEHLQRQSIKRPTSLLSGAVSLGGYPPPACQQGLGRASSHAAAVPRSSFALSSISLRFI